MLCSALVLVLAAVLASPRRRPQPPRPTPCRTYASGLYAKGRVTGQQRGKRNVRTNTNLVQIEGVADAKEAQFYLGKVSLYSRHPISRTCRTMGTAFEVERGRRAGV